MNKLITVKSITATAITAMVLLSSVIISSPATAVTELLGPSPSAGPVSGGTTIEIEVPERLTYLQVGSGRDHSAAVGEAGYIYTWGLNSNGMLGDGTTTTRVTPVVVQAPSNVKFIYVAAGTFHTLGLADDGSVWAWGRNSDGQLGDGTTIDKSLPVKVAIPAGVKIQSIAAFFTHNVAVGDDGKIYTWGSNSSGQIGDGTIINKSTPVAISAPNGAKFADEIAAGRNISMGLTETGELYAWGSNSNGQLGIGVSGGSRTTPTLVQMPLGVTASIVDAGNAHSLAITATGDIYAWGNNGDGELGDGTNIARSTPGLVTMPPGLRFTSVAAGGNHSTAITDDGKLFSWGDNREGQLGDGTLIDKLTPTQVASSAVFREIATGLFHTQAISDTGDSYAWGYNRHGQVGNGVSGVGVNQPTPYQIKRGLTLNEITIDGVARPHTRVSSNIWSVVTQSHTAGTVPIRAKTTLEDGGTGPSYTYGSGFRFVNPPTAVADSIQTNRATPVDIAALSNDISTETLRVTNVSSPPSTAGMVTINTDGTINFAPNPNFTGVTSFTYQIADVLNQFATATVTVTVRDVPVVANITTSTKQDVALTTDVLSNALGNGIQLDSVSTATNGTVVRNANDTVTYTPNGGFFGNDSYTFTIRDAIGQTATGTVSISVVQKVTAVDDTIRVASGQNVVIAPLINDIGGVSLQITSIGTPTNGSALLRTDGTILYSPKNGFQGIDTLTYNISGVLGQVSSAKIFIYVDGVFAATDDTIFLRLNEHTDIDVIYNDIGNNIRVTSVTSPNNGTANIQLNQTIRYTPNINFKGTDTFNYTIEDISGQVRSGKVTIEVVSPPVATNVTAVTGFGIPITIPVLANDSGVGLSVSIVSVKGGSATVNNNGSISFTPGVGFTGNAVVEYLITDITGQTATAELNVAVSPRPQADKVSIKIPSDSITQNISLADSVSGGSLSITNTTIKDNCGDVNIVGDFEIEFTPKPNFAGECTIEYTVTDSFGLSATNQISIIVVAKPITTADKIDLSSGATSKTNVLVNDSGSSLTLSSIRPVSIPPVNTNVATPASYSAPKDSNMKTLASASSNATTSTINSNTIQLSFETNGDVTVTAAEFFVGEVDYIYTVSDDLGQISEGVISIDVKAKDSPANTPNDPNKVSSSSTDNKIIKSLASTGAANHNSLWFISVILLGFGLVSFFLKSTHRRKS